MKNMDSSFRISTGADCLTIKNIECDRNCPLWGCATPLHALHTNVSDFFFVCLDGDDPVEKFVAHMNKMCDVF